MSPSHPRPVQCTVFVMCLLYALSTCQILSVSVLKHFCLYSTYCPLHIHPTASTVLYTFTLLPRLSFTHSPFCLHGYVHIHPSASTVLYSFTHLPPLSFTHSPICLHSPLLIHPSASTVLYSFTLRPLSSSEQHIHPFVPTVLYTFTD